MSVDLSKCCTNTWLSSCSRIHLQHPPGEPYSCLGKRQILGITSIRVFTYCRMVPWSCWRHREVTLECQVSWHWFWKRLVVDGSTSDSTGWNFSWSPGRTCLIWISLKYKIQPKCMESECFYSFLPKNKSQLRGFSASKYSLLCLHCLQLKSKTRLSLSYSWTCASNPKSISPELPKESLPSTGNLLPPEEWSLDTQEFNK